MLKKFFESIFGVRFPVDFNDTETLSEIEAHNKTLKYGADTPYRPFHTHMQAIGKLDPATRTMATTSETIEGVDFEYDQVIFINGGNWGCCAYYRNGRLVYNPLPDTGW